MRKGLCLCSLLIFALAACKVILENAQAAAMTPAAQQNQDQPSVQITSVTVDPATLHTVGEPKTATVTVQFILYGKPPADATAKVEIGTASANPPEHHIEVEYNKQSEILKLKESPGVAKFEVRVAPRSGYGKLRVAATIHGTTGGVKVKDPSEEKNWIAELTILTP